MNRDLKRQLLIQDGRHASRLYAQGQTCAQACAALGRSRQTLWRACRAYAAAHPAEYEAMLRSPQPAPPAALDHDPLLDGWAPQSVTPVTDPDDLLA